MLGIYVSENMAALERRLEDIGEATVQEVKAIDWYQTWERDSFIAAIYIALLSRVIY